MGNQLTAAHSTLASPTRGWNCSSSNSAGTDVLRFLRFAPVRLPRPPTSPNQVLPGRVLTAAVTKPGQKRESLFGKIRADGTVRRRPRLHGLCLHRSGPQPTSTNMYASIRVNLCAVRARQPPPSTAGGARSRARELFCISSCKGNGHASFSCSPHSVVCGECGEGIGSHNS